METTKDSSDADAHQFPLVVHFTVL